MSKGNKKVQVEKSISQPELFRKVGEIYDVVNDVSDINKLLKISLKKIIQLFDARRGSIFILDDDNKSLILRAAIGMKRIEKNRLVKRLGEGIMGKVAELKEPIVVEDISNFDSFKPKQRYRTRSFICCPLLIKDALIGVINIADKVSGQHFDKNEKQLLDLISSQVALNYRRINLYNDFKKVVIQTQNLKDQLGQSDQETAKLKKQIVLQEKFASIGKLAAGIAHEFNNPLDGMMRYTNLCLKQVKGDKKVKEYLLEIQDGLTRMVNMVRSLLDCSRNELPNNNKVHLNEVVAHAIQDLKSYFDFLNIKIQIQIPKSLPKLPDFGIERVLTNIFRNAADAMENTGGEIKINISHQRQNNRIIIKISDTGTGISLDKMEKIFDPFFTTKKIDKGCGLGLTIVGEIIKSYNGSIDVESEMGKGTTFIITIPTRI